MNAVKYSKSLQDELRRKNSFKNSADFGELFETNSYGLHCKKIFHGALKMWTPKDKSCENVSFKMYKLSVRN